jgi:uncharacterized membrane protein
MASKQVTLSIFKDEASADRAAEALKRWDGASDDIKLKSIGILVLNEKGELKTDKVGRRSTGKGAGIGIILAMLTPVGLVAGIIGGGILGALHHKGIGLSDQDRERIGSELTNGKAAVGVVTDSSESAAISAKLTELGGKSEVHDLDDKAVAEVDAAAAAEPVATTT